MIKFLPSYVGSKAYWVDYLEPYKGSDIIELFAGSAVLSANLAETAVLNDLDPYVYKILSRFEELIVPETFTQKDYFNFRGRDDWWKFAYCLQKMSFSGVYRYSKNGFNVPVKKDIQEIHVREDFDQALHRYKELSPIIMNRGYTNVPLKLMAGKVVISDPPYESSKASYNKEFDYDKYWEFIHEISKIAKTVIIFDTKDNLERRLGQPILETRKMRVNGKHKGDVEAISILGENRIVQKEYIENSDDYQEPRIPKQEQLL